jgi:hypothetical protein
MKKLLENWNNFVNESLKTQSRRALSYLKLGFVDYLINYSRPIDPKLLTTEKWPRGSDAYNQEAASLQSKIVYITMDCIDLIYHSSDKSEHELGMVLADKLMEDFLYTGKFIEGYMSHQRRRPLGDYWETAEADVLDIIKNNKLQ